jgi:hypothetical protein
MYEAREFGDEENASSIRLPGFDLSVAAILNAAYPS